jgi:ABC-type nickel/cobalt efflux system permease component RcnA
MTKRLALVFVCLSISSAHVTLAHDIPNARVDRSIQVELSPGKLAIRYEVSLSELTLTQDLRRLIGSLPSGDRTTWFQRYGTETGPLNAKGFVVSIDREPVDLKSTSFDLKIEDHPKFIYHFESIVPEHGTLFVNDSNFSASEGTSRLAIKGSGVIISGDDLPPDVESIAIKPVWQLSTREERRTHTIRVNFAPSTAPVASSLAPAHVTPSKPAPSSSQTLSSLLDRAATSSWLPLIGLAFLLGIAHSIQPGHGKSLIIAGSLGPGGRWRGLALGFAAMIGHMSSVVALAFVLWITKATDYEAWNGVVVHVAGFWLAAIGLWRIGHHLGDFGKQISTHLHHSDLSSGGILSLGLVSGLVPCWDAVALLLLSAALGRLGLGLILLAAFSLGMGAVLATIGFVATRLPIHTSTDKRWPRALGLASGCLLAIMGAIFLLR